jgi:hypothetical protein
MYAVHLVSHRAGECYLGEILVTWAESKSSFGATKCDGGAIWHTRVVVRSTHASSFDGLCAIVAETPKLNPLDGHLFLFRGKVRVIDLPESEKSCPCCGKPMHPIGEECSEQLGYVPASVKIIETRRKKYACKAWLDQQAIAVLPKSGLGQAVSYALKNWDALCRYTEQGYLEPDNNFSGQHMRNVALARKAFLFVGSDRGGKAAAICFSLMESCKVNQVNPLMYMTYLFSNVCNKQHTLLMPHEFPKSDGQQIG